MTSRAATLSPLHGTDLWAQSPESIQATADFFADTRTLSTTLGRNVDLGLRLSLEIARAVRGAAYGGSRYEEFQPEERRAWERVERDAERVVVSLIAADPSDHWWDTFEALSLSLGYLADGILALAAD